MARMNTKVMELIKALEEALPEGEIVVVGNGDHLTDAHKEWLRSLIDEPVVEDERDICDECRLGECCGYCDCCDDDEEDDDIDDEEDDDIEDEEDDEYARGYADAMAEVQKTADEAYDFGKEDAEAELDEETMALVKLIKMMREMFGN